MSLGSKVTSASHSAPTVVVSCSSWQAECQYWTSELTSLEGPRRCRWRGVFHWSAGSGRMDLQYYALMEETGTRANAIKAWEWDRSAACIRPISLETHTRIFPGVCVCVCEDYWLWNGSPWQPLHMTSALRWISGTGSDIFGWEAWLSGRRYQRAPVQVKPSRPLAARGHAPNNGNLKPQYSLDKWVKSILPMDRCYICLWLFFDIYIKLCHLHLVIEVLP